MDIKTLSNSINAGRPSDVNKPADKGVNQNNNSATTAEPTDRVTLTDILSQTRELEAKSESVKVDNSERIAELKAAIADGSYQIDAKSVANKLMQTELLFQK